jgi:creatinine amidohydrolase
MEAADCAMLLGQPDQAVVTFQHGLAILPAQYQRDRAVNLARLAVAYAASQEPELACAVAQEAAAAIVASTWSARAVAELRRLPRLLSGWPDSAAVAELEATLAALPWALGSWLWQATAHGPIDDFEQHGDFLPLITDTVVACLIARRVSADYGLFLLPPVTLSCSHEHSRFAGTVSISASTLAAVVSDVAESLHASGIDRLAVVNGHGGNYVLANVVQQANVAGPRMTLFPSRTDWDVARTAAGLVSTASEDMHAGELEVSLLLHGYPELVEDGYRSADWQANPRPHLLVTGMRGYTETGVIGRPSLASADKGRALLEGLTRSFKDHLALLS